MYSREVNWFEFEVHKRQERTKVSIPADSYKDALNKIKRIHPDCMISLVRQWTKKETPIAINKSSSAKPKKTEAKAKPKPKPRLKPPPKKEPKAEPKPTTKPYWETLGVPQEATLSEIKKAYVQRLKEYHPDRVADMGPEIKKLAEEKTFEILKAFNEAKRTLGNQ